MRPPHSDARGPRPAAAADHVGAELHPLGDEAAHVLPRLSREGFRVGVVPLPAVGVHDVGDLDEGGLPSPLAPVIHLLLQRGNSSSDEVEIEDSIIH